MRGYLRHVSITTLVLITYVSLTQFASGFYAAAGSEPNAALGALGSIGLLWALCSWLQRDLRLQGLGWTLDVGLYVSALWFFVLPYYLIKTRGPKGVLTMLVFLGIYIGSLVLGIIAYLLLEH